MSPIVSRRAALAAVGGGFASLASHAGLAGSPQCTAVPKEPDRLPPLRGPALGDLARAKGIDFGVQTSIPFQPDYGAHMYDPLYWGLIEREKPAFVAYGSQLNFGFLCPDPPGSDGRLSFANSRYKIKDMVYAANDLTALARKSGLKAHADALIWDSSQGRPPWLRKIAEGAAPDRTANPDLAWNLARMEDFIEAAVAKMVDLSAGDPDFFRVIGVVNEPIEVYQTPGKVNYRGAAFAPPGIYVEDQPKTIDYIAAAFRATDRAKRRLAAKLGRPAINASLIINDDGFTIDQFGPQLRPAMLALLKRMLSEGVPVQGLGIEAHLAPQMMNSPLKPDWSAYGDFLDQVAALGLEIHITELDVLDYVASCDGKPARPAEADALVAHYYETFLTRTLACKAVKSVCVWDLSDRYSFYRYLDLRSWWGYDRLTGPRGADGWPRCRTIPAGANALPCPRPNLYDDLFLPKSARAAVARAFEQAPTRAR